MYATGFEGELTPFARRAGHTIIGRGGITMEEKWKDGVISLHGMTTHGFPNMALVGHMRDEQQQIRDWVERHAAVQEDMRRLLRRLSDQREKQL